jgi:hypothetical protein
MLGTKWAQCGKLSTSNCQRFGNIMFNFDSGNQAQHVVSNGNRAVAPIRSSQTTEFL